MTNTNSIKAALSSQYLAVGLLGLIGILAGCSSTETEIANVSSDTIGENPTVVNGDPSANSFDPANLPAGMTERQKERLQAAFNANVQLPENTVQPGLKAKPASRPAPDDSEYFSSLTDVATETRVFKGHPVLNKVERITDGKNVRLKIHLKNGRVIDADGQNVKNMPVASASTFMEIGGLPPLPTPTPPPASTMNKKKQDDAAQDRDPKRN